MFKYDANGNMVNIIKGHEKTTYVYDDENRLTSVYSTTTGKAGVNVASYSYDGDGGRTRKVVNRRDKAVFHSKETTAFMYKDYNGKPWPGTIKNPKRIVTRYVGQLYEEEDPGSDGQLRKTKYIYLGSMRIAAVSGGGMSYYLSDHLGGTNVLTDKTGLPKQLTEYDPFGLIIKSEDYGNPSAALWHYFTGKPLDDETGLMYYGARYYNPKLGRFITPDTLIPRPDNPQEFNRYSYVLNNPVNRVDPSGHKSWWKKFWGGVKDFFRDNGGLFGLVGNIFNGIVNQNWDPLRNQVIAGISAFVMSGFNPVAGAAAVLTTGFLDSKPGKQVTNFVASEIMDDAFGMRPGSAQVWARIGLQIAGTLVVQNVIQNGIVDPKVTTKNSLTVDKTKTGDPIIDDSKVRAGLDKAWLQSKDGQNIVQEQGGFILKNESGGYSIQRWKPGGSGSINLPKSISKNAVAAFHTHPYAANEVFIHGPSGADYTVARTYTYGLTNYIVDRDGVMAYEAFIGSSWGQGTYTDIWRR